MRFAAYAGTSMVLATGVVIRALHERANFYSASVYLAQSNACLMVLTNIALLGVCTCMLGLQRLFYGPLRPIEVEQLYEKAWFAITETCLAMTIFREEVGGWFLVMFVCLLIGKVWGWIGEGRVEILEQQPPSNPRLFHARLSISLIISTLFDIFMLRYSIHTVLRHARPNMMVMFAFEFAVLTVTSISTAARYTISVYEANIIKVQIRDRRTQMRRERELVQHRNDTAAGATPDENSQPIPPAEDDIDSLDIDVPGWEEKGRWVFYLDLATDFFKLILYLTFFCVLCMFYGMPIHIIRDVALTIRSFYKRITDFVRYRQATRDMNARYPDATPEEVAREDVCIICREEMRPWRQQNGPDHQQGNNTLADRSLPNSVDERLRPKKLPCGHILHFACLRSWLERQQNCPTCRRPVLVTATVTHAQEHGLANQHGRDRGQPNHPQAHVPLHGNPQQPIAAQNVFNLGPLRIAFGARHGIPGPPHQQNPPPPTPQGPVPTVGQIPHMTTAPESSRHLPGLPSRTIANFSPANVQLQLIQIEQQLLRDINALRVQQNQLHLVRALQGELARLRIAQANPEMLFGGPPQAIAQPRVSETMSQTVQVGQSFVSVPQQQILGHSHPGLPAGMTLPPGWTILPLQRLPDSAGANPAGRYGATARSAQMQTQGRNPTSGPTPRDANASPSTMNPNSESSFGLSGLAGHNFASKQPDYGASSSSTTQSYIAPSSLDEHVATDRPTEQDCGDESHASTGSTPNVFKWGSKSRSGELSQGELGDVGNSELETTPASGATIGDEGATLQTSTDTRQGKGKGRATTVEDSTEDID